MTLPLWGQLQKSQDDSETIEQAIFRIVEEHNNDPESHLNEGESLSEHKKDDVIDHPPNSVVADKWSASELRANISSRITGSYLSDGLVIPTGVNEFTLQIEDEDPGPQVLFSGFIANTHSFIPGLNFDHDFVLDCAFAFVDLGAVEEFYFGLIYNLFGFGSIDLDRGIYWRSIDDELRIVVRDGVNEVISPPISSTLTTMSYYRLHYDFSSKTLFAFVNGVQVSALDLSSFSGSIFTVRPVGLLYGTENAGKFAELSIGSINYIQSLI